jgi:tetratricopeptide (TPR) repeat protein
MTVRWKPLIVLTALFVLLAAAGLFAFTRVLFPARAEDLLPLARAEAESGKYDRAEIHYRRALQRDPKNPRIHFELAEMLGEWMRSHPDQSAKLRPNWLTTMHDAAKYGAQMPEPRRLLLADALDRGEWADCVHWAREIEPLEKTNLDAHYVLAVEAMSLEPPRVAEARTHVQFLLERDAKRSRTLWIRARLAEGAKDDKTLAEMLSAARDRVGDGTPEDQFCAVRLRLIDFEQTSDAATLAERVSAFRSEAAQLVSREIPPARGRELMTMLRKVHQHVDQVASASKADERKQLESLPDLLADLAESTFEQSVKSSQGVDLRPHQSYAEYLLFRGRRARCIEVVADALKRPVSTMAFWVATAMELREIGIKAALSDSNDPDRFQKAAPHIKDLLASNNARYRALGHLFQGVIDLELSGLSETLERGEGGAPAPARDARRVASALSHLKAASEGLKDVATAQALYGVALLLGGEPALGRQYLQLALRGGGGRLDPRYQIWAALSVLQAGYVEDAEPIINDLLSKVATGQVSADLAGTLHLIKAEVHQSRGNAEDLRLARAEYLEAFSAGHARTPALELRLAHLAAMLGDDPSAFKTIEKLSQDAQSGPSAERVAALTLFQQGKTEDAMKRADQGRQKYPESPELVELSAALRVQAGHADEAEQLVGRFLDDHPNQEELGLFRAKLLSESLNRTDDARNLLIKLCETSTNSAPWILLAHIELGRKDFVAATAVIEKIRTRWPDAAAVDLLAAQAALGQGNLPLANKQLESALKRDPSNKVALFWKGRLDELTGSTIEAQAIYEQLARERPLKEIENGMPLGTAAQWALAAMALERQQFDVAVSRYESLLREAPTKEMARSARWNLALARAAKGETAQAKTEVGTLLQDPKTTAEERVQAADFFRRHGDEARAVEQIGLVLKEQPAHPGAITYKALMLLAKDKVPEAIALVRSAIAAGQAPAGLYLLQAALENQGGGDGLPRAKTALEEGIKRHSDHLELLRARYQIMSLMNDPAALEVLEAEAGSRPAAQVLIDAFRDRGQIEKAVALVEARLKRAAPASILAKQLTAQHIALIAAQAGKAEQADNKAEQKRLMEQAIGLLSTARKTEPDHLPYIELEAELALQARDFAKAKRLAEEISNKDRANAAGPVLLARVASAEGKLQDVERAYEQAVERSPARAELRLALAQAHLSSGRYDDAVRQASVVMEAERDMPSAKFVKAQALARSSGSDQAVENNRTQAEVLLRSAIQDSPAYVDAYHLLSDLLVLRGKRTEAIALLKTCLAKVPSDDEGLSLLVQRLCEQPNDTVAVKQAQSLANERAADDKRGVFALAAAIGFHRAGRSDLALPWAESASSQLDLPNVHLIVGDILLSCAEHHADSAEAQAWLTSALAHYDKVLAKQPNSIEAINNKAWILHRYLDRNAESLQLAEGLIERVDPASLPPDFLDTLGSIQEAAGKTREAEVSYARGLRAAPDHGILNFHLGRLLSKQGKDPAKANACLEKARQSAKQLPADMASELAQISAPNKS